MTRSSQGFARSVSFQKRRPTSTGRSDRHYGEAGGRLTCENSGTPHSRKIKFDPVVETSEDCYGRCAVRVKELFTSVDIIRQAVRQIPEGPIEIKVTGAPDGEYFSRVEQPRGELVHYLKGNGKRNLVRSRVRTPTLTNIPPLVAMAERLRTRGRAGHCPFDPTRVSVARRGEKPWEFSRWQEL